VSDLRVGLGVDAHTLAEGVPLVLGGIRFDYPRGLVGHSDGDVIAHALVDALLGAADLGDIGTLFPSDDPALEGIDSLDMLARAYERVREAGYELVNASCVLVGEEPRISERRGEMAAALAGALGVAAELISITATTTDRLGFTGRGEGLGAEAIALVAAVRQQSEG
jgi:2-C-methyl-D-erythritol 2,4-cyclodiphosphate synthase